MSLGLASLSLDETTALDGSLDVNLISDPKSVDSGGAIPLIGVTKNASASGVPTHQVPPGINLRA